MYSTESVSSGIEIALGDCLEVMGAMPDGCVDMVLTDPPYNINLVPQRGTFEAIANDNLSDEDFDHLLASTFAHAYRLLADDAFCVSFCGWSTIPQFRAAAEAAGFELKSMPVWVKNNWGIGYYTRPQYEPMLLLVKGRPPKPERPISDVIRFPTVVNKVHSCEKPVEMLGRLMTTFCPEGGFVLDPYMGSGSCGSACIAYERRFLGIELDEAHYETAKNRLIEESSQMKLAI